MDLRLAPLPTHLAGGSLGAEVVAAFRKSGVLRLSAAIPRSDIERCEQTIWQETLAAQGAPRDPHTWPALLPAQLKALGRRPEFWFSESAIVREALDELLGPTRAPTKPGGTFFAGGPYGQDQPWALPIGHSTWHWDGRPDLQPQSIWVFTILAPLPSQAGGTLVVSGSSTLIAQLFAELPEQERRMPSKHQRERFRQRHRWFAALQDGDPACASMLVERPLPVDGVEVQIVDVHGDPGDVVLMAGWTIHASPPRIAPRPRLIHVGGVPAQ